MPEEVQMIGNGDVFSFEDFDAHLRSGHVRAASVEVLPVCIGVL